MRQSSKAIAMATLISIASSPTTADDARGFYFGAGADIDVSPGWNARLEWERYSATERLDRDIFSVSFKYKF